MRPKRASAGMSLTELLVVTTVILILISILVVGIESVYSQAMQVKCKHRLEQIGYGLQMYSSEHNSWLPRSWDAYSGKLWYEVLAMKHIEDPRTLCCPSVGDVPPQLGGGAAGSSEENREDVEEILSLLRWLSEQQTKTGTYKGRWTSDNTYHGGYCCGVTGLVLMAYFGFGCTDTHPPEFAETIKMGVEFLCSDVAQTKSGADAGLFKDNHAKLYGQGIGIMALCAASRMIEDAELRGKARAAAQLALDYIVGIQPDHGAFSYSVPATDKGDTSANSWVYQAMGTAIMTGLSVPSSAVAKGETCLQHIMRPSDGLCSYTFPTDGYPGWWIQDRNTQVGLTARVAMRGAQATADVLKQMNFLSRSSGGHDNHHIWLLINGSYMYPADGKDFYRHWHTTRAFRRIGDQPGKNYWTDWYAAYPEYILKHLVGVGSDMGYFPADCAGTSTQIGGGTTVGTRYSTALGVMMLTDAFGEHWYDESWRPGTGACSYGYNNRLGAGKESIAGDAILVMDYSHWEIDHDDTDVDSNDTLDDIAARHGGTANALFGDYSVRPVEPEGVREGMWTLRADD